MFCKKCGTEQKAGEKFCKKCGTQYLILDTNTDIDIEKKQKQEEAPSTVVQSSSDTINQIEQEAVKSNEYADAAKSINEDIKNEGESTTPIPESENTVEDKSKYYYSIIIIGILSALEWYFYDGLISDWGGILFILCASCYVFHRASLMEDTPFPNFIDKILGTVYSVAVSTKIIAVFVVINVFVFSCNGGLSGGGYDSDGYKYVLSNLKAPTSAVLLKYITKDKVRQFAKERTKCNIPKKLELESYTVEAENSFGGRVKADYVVFFWKGKPIYVEEDGLLFLNDPIAWSEMLDMLKMQTGIDFNE